MKRRIISVESSSRRNQRSSSKILFSGIALRGDDSIACAIISRGICVGKNTLLLEMNSEGNAIRAWTDAPRNVRLPVDAKFLPTSSLAQRVIDSNVATLWLDDARIYRNELNKLSSSKVVPYDCSLSELIDALKCRAPSTEMDIE